MELSVYDALGKEVQTLVNPKSFLREVMKRISMEVIFRAEFIFHKLQTENFSDVKRMTLLK